MDEIRTCFQIPEQQLPAGQLLRAAYVQTFKNRNALIGWFFPWSVVWCAGFGILDCSAYYSFLCKDHGVEQVTAYLVCAGLIGLLVQFLAGWHIAKRCFALSMHLLDSRIELDVALVRAESEKNSIFRGAFIPILFEALLGVVVFIAQFLYNAFYDPKGPLYTPIPLTIAGLQFIYYFLWVPHMTAYAVMGIIFAEEIRKKYTFAEIIDDCAGSFQPSFFYHFKFLAGITFAVIAFVFPLLVAMLLDKVYPFSMRSEVVNMIVWQGLTAPLAAFFFGLLTVAGTFQVIQRRNRQLEKATH